MSDRAPEPKEDDPYVDWGMRFATEQMKAAIPDLAPVFALFFKTLVSEGLTRQEALILTVEFIRKVFVSHKPEN